MRNEIIIYMISNRINNKKYIGQTINYDKRMKEHIYGRNTINNSVIDRSIKKYGKESFDFIIIDKAYDQESADGKERHYIKLYNSLKPNGYNILKGGRNQQGSWNSKKVYMYSLKGDFEQEFDSAQEIERWSNSFYLREGVRDCCNHKRYKYKDKVFLYEYHQKINEYKKPKSSRSKKVYQFDKTGNLIASFDSLQVASIETNTSRTSISGCLRGDYKTANGFIWSSCDEIDNPTVEISRTRIMQVDDDFKVIHEYKSCASAERNLNLRKGAYKTIYSVLNKNKKRYGYYWLRK